MALAIKGGGMVAVLLLFEWLTPLHRDWGMAWRHVLRRDLVMILVNGAFIAGLNFALLALSIRVATTGTGVMADQPLLVQIVVGLLAFEALQYSMHRVMHTNTGSLSRFLWRTHSIHRVARDRESSQCGYASRVVQLPVCRAGTPSLSP